MARKKVPIQPTLSTWQDVDDAMKEILNCEGCVDEIEVNLNREITLAKEKADAASKPMRERISELEVQIRDFVSRHREELDGKSKRLNFGQTGFRLSTKFVVPASKSADIIASLRRYGMVDCITTKESVNKDVLRKYPGEDILKTGAYLKSDDEFWYEVSSETIKSAE